MSAEWKKEAYKCQKEWSQLLYKWKYFENPRDELIKTYIGIGLFGFTDFQNASNFSLYTYYKNYSEQQQKSIDKIVKQIESLNGKHLELGHTYLYLNENSIVCCIFRCRIKKQTFFIEPTGRAYNSWDHFLETNELPVCEFVAPKNGVYTKKSEIQCYRTPTSKRWLDKSQSVMDWVCAIAGIGCTVLGIFALAPAVVTSTAVAVGIRNVQKSIASILDHKEHHQLASLSAVNGGISLAAFALTAVSGISKTYEVISLASEQSSITLKIIRALNISDKLIETGSLGTYLLHLCYRVQKGNFSNVDALELAAQIFVLYGAVVDVQRLHQTITHECVSTRADLAVEFTYWMRRKEKDYVRVQECNPLIALKLIASRNPKISFRVLRKFYSKNEVILNICFDINHSSLDYLCEKINLNEFCLELRPLVMNLWTLLDEDFIQMKHIVQQYTHQFIDNDTDLRNICKLLCFVASEVKKIENTEKPHEKSFDLVSSTETTCHKVIIETVKSLVIQNNVYSSSEHIITTFYEALLFTTTKVMDIVTETYQEIIAFNRSIVGEERLQAILERIRASTVDEYFHHDRAFSNAINKFKQENDFQPQNESLEFPVSNQLVREICDEIIMLYESAYSQATGSLQLSLLDTMNTLQNVSLSLNEKLIREMDKIRIQNATYTQMNALLNQSASSDLSLSELKELQILREAKSRLQMEEIQSIESPEIAPIRRTTKNEFQMYEALLIICSNFYQRTNQIFEEGEKSTLLPKIYFFIISKFISLMKVCSEDEDSLDSVKTRDGDCKLIFAICSSTESLFYAVLEKFDDEKYLNELMNEFLEWPFDEWSYNKIPIWKEIIVSNEFQLRCIHYSRNQAEQYCEDIISKLFDINDEEKFEIVRNVNSMFLKSFKKFIVLNFVTPEIILVYLINLRRPTG